MKPALVIRCNNHPTYTGLTKLTRDCVACAVIRRMRGAGVMLTAYDPDAVNANDVEVRVTARWGAS